MKHKVASVSVLSLWILGLAFCSVAAQEKPAQRQETVGHLFQPAQRQFSESLVRSLTVPTGFQIQVFARNLGKARMLAVAPDGFVYLTRPQQNDVVALHDRDGDGRADVMSIVLSNLEKVHGIAIRDNRLYLGSPKRLYAAERATDGKLGTPRVLIDDLPDGGQHPNRTIAFGPDGALYISVGSTCNACKETNPEHAALLRLSPGGRERTIFASGLRNTIGFDWHPVTRQLWGMDHGSDWRGDHQPPEELNQLQKGKNYGWPFCYGNREIDRYIPSAPEGMKKEEYCASTEAPVLMTEAHSAPIAMLFYGGSQFPNEYHGDAFVAMHGSWNRKIPTGYSVQRIRFDRGKPAGFENFLTGFLSRDQASYFGRPAGLAVARIGSLLISDDANGVIYSVSHGKELTSR